MDVGAIKQKSHHSRLESRDRPLDALKVVVKDCFFGDHNQHLFPRLELALFFFISADLLPIPALTKNRPLIHSPLNFPSLRPLLAFSRPCIWRYEAPPSDRLFLGTDLSFFRNALLSCFSLTVPHMIRSRSTGVISFPPDLGLDLWIKGLLALSAFPLPIRRSFDAFSVLKRAGVWVAKL